MFPLSPAELEAMRSTQSGSLQDTCLIAEPTTAANAYNLNSETWDWVNATQKACGFNANPSREVLNQVPTSEVTLRLASGVSISNRARVRVTKRFGETESGPLTYEVVGLPKTGPSGLTVWMKKLTDGS